MHPAPGRDVGDDGSLATDDDDLIVENPAQTPERVEGPDDEHDHACEGRPTGLAAPS